ncbi:hypothetical protein A2661_00535 [Candidatus Giovannonibacteria bacterium RIFCSPHIGHO2_01_FULL_45_24]|uniref:Sugar 3,4-ketoisomerase QdtA cupin domain-containing protein n=1 Tax=Candidatus Giovannonibacteria bacterium RIFCSPLOWO2_01_FULL_46_32 TaxID=1798353 RepID=A0A1F5XGK2_9BACT|nr:MAG: hypothetical protein A2661_00535 [Candidatus Giovannonibacteria bacterium RIFCSPHIGHO2_01_FULL_45_24]OGF87064.1 MAG: hypothetical protein A3B19_01375 [Candidatus Giovannonibacteria bacterium RIFCSPLOWO2_01_FULL_46_32]
MTKWAVVKFLEFVDQKRGGVLVASEVIRDTNGAFEAARRVYYIVNNTGDAIKRGGHYHPHGGKQEIWLVPVGRVTTNLHSAKECQEVVLDSRDRALFIPGDVWHDARLDPGTVLICIASTNYNPAESISSLPSCACKKL